ncbi:sensor histidine kinase [Bacillus sp. FJAT-45350]|uniref:sensor histidine kinase n=1 Tax=Bacillus sp. FJAT-45350 TaxID=2011014 RepID=UPI000BB7BA90|nr:ATP-binding protein [Bacillus sp. FJAT-45350]
MNFGIKTRLLLAFLSIIIMPILTILGLLYIFSTQLEEMEVEQSEKLDLLFQEVKNVIIEEYEHINEQNKFFQEIEPLLLIYDIDITITDESGLLFTSVDYRSNTQIENEFIFDLDQLQAFQFFIEPVEGEVLTVDLKANSFEVEPFTSIKQILLNIFLAIGGGFVVLVGLIVGWTWYISRTILQPLKQIYQATEEMRDGNLDYKIDYNKKDEIGRFINGFNLMREKQKLYEKNRKELIASISHDLRTPLASIKGYVEGLQDGVVKSKEMEQKYLRVIKTKTEQLDYLIEDLFDFSKLDLEQLPMEKVTVGSHDFFTEVIYNGKMDAAQQGVKLDVKGEIPNVSIDLDPFRIEQVLMNLLENGVRYGGTMIDVGFSVNKEVQELQVVISDNGRGISKKEIPMVFNRFYRGEKSRSREHGGTGLGLAISKLIIEAHEGRIWVESEEGEGCQISFTLPI